MTYHESGVPRFRSGSVVVVPADVRVTERYGAGISATPYAHSDRNGLSIGVVKDVLRGQSTRGSTLVIRDSRTPTPRRIREDRAAAERRIAGTIGNVE